MLITLIVSIVPFVFGAWYIQNKITEQEKQNFKIHSYETLSKMHSRINNESIEPTKKIISLLAMDGISSKLGNILKNHQIAKPADIDSNFYRYLINYSNLYPNIIGVALGTQQGGYIEIPSFFTEPGYDPRTRPWYQGALNHRGQAFLTDPYIMQTTGEMVITVAHTVEDNGDVIGVLGSAYNLNDLQKEAEELQLGLSGYIVLINQNNKVIIASKHKDWLMNAPQEFGFPDFFKLKDNELYNIMIDGKRQIAFTCKSDTGWLAISVIDESELQGKVNEVLLPIIIAYCITIFVILISIFHVSQVYVINPIKAFAEGTAEIAGNNLNAKVNIVRNDEFGMLASNFNEMAKKLKINFNQIGIRLFQQEKELQTLLENIQDIILRIDKNRNIIYLNPVFELYFSTPIKDLLGKNIKSIMMPECFLKAVKEILDKCQNTCDNELLEFEFTANTGETIYFQACLIPEFHRYEFPESVLAVIRNVTQQKLMEKQLARMDRLNVIGKMAASLAHEIRNPMTTVRGFLQMISKREPNSPYISFYDTMIEELDRANAIITEFLSLSKNKKVNLERHNLNDIITTIAPLLQASATMNDKFVTLELEQIPDCCIDDNEIRQMILNLVRNGLDASNENGIVTIKTRFNQDSVLLTIKDQGPGIDPIILENIGMPFLTTRESGTGLGLAVCYSIAARHNAKIYIQTGAHGTEVLIQFSSIIN